MELGERVTLAQLKDQLGISYEAVRRSFWRKVKTGDMDGHYEKVGTTIYLDEVGADLIRAGRRPVVITEDGTSEKVAALTAENESLRASLAEYAVKLAAVFEDLAEERKSKNELLEENRDLKIKLLTSAEDPGRDTPQEPAQPDVQPEEPQEQPKRTRWFWRLFNG